MLKTLVTTFQTVMGSSLSQQSAVDIISDWRSKPAHELIFDSTRPELYLQAIDKLQQSPKGHSELLSKAMARLKQEFKVILSRQADYLLPVGPNSTMEWSSVTDSTAYTLRYEDYAIYEPPSREVVIYLKSIVERMNLNGDLEECVKLYKSARKNFLQAQLKRLHFDELRIGDNNTRRFIWDELKVKIELWIQASKICVKILFEREKQFCWQIFENIGDDYVKDKYFIGTVQDFADSLFAFAKRISTSSQPYDRMGSVLGLYDAFWSVLPDVFVLFGSESGESIRNVCSETLLRLKDDVMRMLYDFQTAVFLEISFSVNDKGEVNQTTKYVAEQIDLIGKYKNLLTSLIKSTPSLSFNGLIISKEEFEDFESRDFLELHLILIIIMLKRNLSKKCQRYNDPSLRHLFMMNNERYIVQKIEGSGKLREIIGLSYLKKLNENVELEMRNYIALTCSKFLTCFQEEDLYVTGCFKPRLSKTVLKKRLNAFNTVYEEIQRVHSSWMVSDSILAKQIRLAMLEQLVPAYTNFIEKFNNLAIEGRGKKSFKYLVQDLEDLVSERLFSGAEVNV